MFHLFFFWQDVSQQDIPIMLVGSKCDLRQEGVKCVPVSYGEKLAMVKTNATYLCYYIHAFIVRNYISSLCPTDIQHSVL